MKILSVSKIQANEDPQVLTLTMDLEDANGDADEDLVYTYSPTGQYGGELQVLVAQWLADHQGEYSIEPYVPAPAVPAVYQIAKTTPWLRMTDDEAATMDAVMSETSARVKQIYMAAQYLASNDPLWQTLSQILTDSFGADRAAAILAPES